MGLAGQAPGKKAAAAKRKGEPVLVPASAPQLVTENDGPVITAGAHRTE